MITQEELKKQVNYDPETGLFTRLYSCRKVKQGDLAGTFKWRYVRIKLNNVDYYAHRLAWLYMTGEWPKELIDHIDGDKHNNKFSNLRECNPSQNALNSVVRANNQTGLKGVRVNKRDKLFMASSVVNKQYHYLGSFKSPDDAAKAYKEFAIKTHGEFYRELP